VGEAQGDRVKLKFAQRALKLLFILIVTVDALTQQLEHHRKLLRQLFLFGELFYGDLDIP
jgi:hypothetical protein